MKTLKLPFLLSFYLFTHILPAAANVICVTAESQIARYYDGDGSRGSDGRSGRDGRSGKNVTIKADGTSLNLDLSGKDGEDGEDGEDGSRPHCRGYGDEGRENITAPNGGSGGNGGRGGNGGNGGILTVLYQNLADLKNIVVLARGGEPGRGGRGGRGTAGCSCGRRRWEVKNCTGNSGSPDYKCSNRIYRCSGGFDGIYGRDGVNGVRGKLGILRIVKGQESLAEDNPTAELTISRLINQGFLLSKNKWQIRQGAKSLLAIGSVIDDEYQEFESRLEGSLNLVWNEKEPISNFANQMVNLTLNDNQLIDVNFPDDLWVNGVASLQGNVTEYRVNNVIKKDDVTRLAVADFANYGDNLVLRIVDLAGKSEVINTRFKIKYTVQDGVYDSFNNQAIFEEEIPVELVSREYNRFSIAVGKLSKIPGSALQPGTNVNMEITVVRFLGSRSTQQKINWQGTIRKVRS
ncbi:collagen-like protein [Anabaena sp. FACHB-1237]|uniref:collagen-like protein n=1 Tax=Anabaena sp. FACHB-1237 TaxID=2692769 RepID=UPI0016815DA4|nr:collagen-like protein [Anabaena sp. FACHB-1237]MBD2136852.1 collagen-like protein [Anabaena sp. FACHB-1237]